MIAAMNSPNAIAHKGSEIAIGDLITLTGELLGTKTLARALLNWQGQFCLKEGLDSTIAWVASHMHLCHRGLGEYVV